jgi:O-antigen biosynthesis protein
MATGNRSIAPVSVAVATMDRPNGLARFLDALLGGNSLPAEIIVTDQSRGPETERLIERYRTAPVPVVYYKDPLRGLSNARNAAIACASYPVIAFSDDDCVPDVHWIETIGVTFAHPNAPDGVSGRVLPLGPEASGTYAVSERVHTEPKRFKGKHIPWFAGTGGNFAVRKSWFEKAGLFDPRLGTGSPGRAAEDAEMIYRLLAGDAVLAYDPEMVIYHERQSQERYFKTCFSYPFGIGAFCALTLRRKDWYGIFVFLYWLQISARLLAGDLFFRGQWKKGKEYVLGFLGITQGFAYGLRLTPEVFRGKSNE